MNCDQVRNEIPLAVGGDLVPQLQKAVMEHVKTCLSCYRLYHEYEESLEALHSLKASDPSRVPDGILDAVMADVRTGVPGPAAPPPRVPVWARVNQIRRVAVPFAAGLAVMASAAFFMEDDPTLVTEPEIEASPLTSGNEIVGRNSDSFGMDAILPDRTSGTLRLVGPASFRKTEPLPPARLRTVGLHNDF